MDSIKCLKCLVSFKSHSNLNRHILNNVCKKDRIKLECDVCSSKFFRNDNLMRHKKLVHRNTNESMTYLCNFCQQAFDLKDELIEHKRSHVLITKFKLLQSAHNDSCSIYRLDMPEQTISLDSALNFCVPKIKKLLTFKQKEKKYFKFNMCLVVRFIKDMHVEAIINDEGIEGSEVLSKVPFRTESHAILMHDNINTIISSSFSFIIQTIEDFIHEGSNWTLTNILYLDVEIGVCTPLYGSACGLHIPTYKNKKVCVENPHLTKLIGGRCFFHAVARKFCETDSIFKLDKYSRDNFIENISSPVNVKDINKFEKANNEKNLSISINVIFCDENSVFFPCHKSSNILAKNRIVLLLFYLKNKDDLSNNEMHYAYVENLGNLLAKRYVSNNGRWYSKFQNFCFNCFNTFQREQALINHQEWCWEEKSQRLRMPRIGSVAEFDVTKNRTKRAFFIAYDFECNQKVPDFPCECLLKKPKCEHKSQVIAEQWAIAFGLVVISRENKVMEYMTYAGNDAANVFIETLLKLEKKYTSKIQNYENYKLTSEQKIHFEKCTHCYFCKDPLNGDKCVHHNHLLPPTESYVYASHILCNSLAREKTGIVALSHNFSRYDGHIVCRALGDFHDRGLVVSMIPNNTQQMKVIQINDIIMLDSLAFLNGSLDKLVQNLVASNHDFSLLKQWQPDPNIRKLLLAKGVFFYEYVTSLEKLNKTKKLPPKEAFYSSLNLSHISDADYERAQLVWDTFKVKSATEYMLLYVLLDCFQLAESLSEFRDSLYEDYELDILDFISLPSISYECFLKFSKEKLPLLNDIDMLGFFKEAVRGGMSYVGLRYADVDILEKQTGSKYNIVPLDINGLYGFSMCFPLPHSDFKFLSQKEINEFDLNMISLKSDRGYFFDVTLNYSKKLHMKHNSYPLGAKKMTITEDILSPYSIDCLQILTGKKKEKSTKLVSSFLDKRLTIHGLNILLFINLGIKVEKIHKIVSFKQKAFVKEYIEKCVQKRRESLTVTRSNLQKLLQNSLFGRFLLDRRKMMNCRMIFNETRAKRSIGDPRFHAFQIYSPNMSISFMKKAVITIDQLYHVGAAILDISKFVAGYIYYKELLPKFEGNMSLLSTDTGIFYYTYLKIFTNIHVFFRFLLLAFKNSRFG